ncbi:hypothetical protein [Photobacterium lipolyticum]|uniref:Uncharacterized protein n=1 Tax=Photobacterium lipolyticum TaxID=266810 RepID=A0A2T3N552_9GAMM|nr:hypothetical protein [Photobacterium lipolyticum]PSW07572.1 hypothetical protein C9I89_02365 [Photobacterium lipolyticum]
MRIYSPAVNSPLKNTHAEGQQKIEKIPLSGRVSADVKEVKAFSGTNSQTTQLAQLLFRFDALQRLFTTLSLVSSLPGRSPSPITQLLPQLLIPQHQALLVNWLKHGAGNKMLGEILTQLATPKSTLNQWLQTLPESHQDDLKALLRLAAEQRVGEPPQHSDDTVIQLLFPQPSGRELRLKIHHQQANANRKHKDLPSKWMVELTLPVGSSDAFNATAVWCDGRLNLAFESENAAMIDRVEHLSPLLLKRLGSMGITTDTIHFSVSQDTGVPLPTKGLSIMV